MKVRDIMTHGFEFVQSRDSLQYVAKRMKERGIGSLPVFEENCPVGIVTDRDIVLRGVAEGLDPEKTTVGEILEEGIVYCQEDTPVWQAAQIMHEHKVRRLLIQNVDQDVSGIVSIADFARLDDCRLVGDLMQALSLDQ